MAAVSQPRNKAAASMSLSPSSRFAVVLGLSVVCFCAAVVLEDDRGDATLGLEIDDECLDESCALNELQLRMRASSGAAAMEETFSDSDDQADADEKYTYSRRRMAVHWAQTTFGEPSEGEHGTGRRRRLVMWKPTPIYSGDMQPELCGNVTLKKGFQGCCAGQLFNFSDTGCCGSLLFYTNSLSCCIHANRTATIYNSQTTNCCDDPRVENANEGEICHIKAEEPTCCTLATGRRRRQHRRRQGSPNLLPPNEAGKVDDDDDSGDDDA